MAAPEKKKLVPMIIGGVAVVAIAVGGTLWFIDKERFETTDNAFVQADTVQVSPQISGAILEVLVADNQRVEPGQVVARIDPSTFQAKLDQADRQRPGPGRRDQRRRRQGSRWNRP
jgi:membrane fusion protein (multidrug efflux system)